MSGGWPRSSRASGGDADGLDHRLHDRELLLVPSDQEAPSVARAMSGSQALIAVESVWIGLRVLPPSAV